MHLLILNIYKRVEPSLVGAASVVLLLALQSAKLGNTGPLRLVQVKNRLL